MKRGDLKPSWKRIAHTYEGVLWNESFQLWGKLGSEQRIKHIYATRKLQPEPSFNFRPRRRSIAAQALKIACHGSVSIHLESSTGTLLQEWEMNLRKVCSYGKYVQLEVNDHLNRICVVFLIYWLLHCWFLPKISDSG